MSGSETLRLIDLVIAEVLASIQSTEARDHAARCLQDRFGSPAQQPYNIFAKLEKEGSVG